MHHNHSSIIWEKQNITKGVIIIINEWRHVTSSLKANNYYNYYEDD